MTSILLPSCRPRHNHSISIRSRNCIRENLLEAAVKILGYFGFDSINLYNHPFRLVVPVRIKEIIAIDYADYILCLNNTDGHFDSMKQLIAPQGKICSIVETKAPLDLGGTLQQKSVTFVWELMFTRSLFQTHDMIEQHHLLNTVAELIDTTKIKSTLIDLLLQ